MNKKVIKTLLLLPLLASCGGGSSSDYKVNDFDTKVSEGYSLKETISFTGIVSDFYKLNSESSPTIDTFFKTQSPNIAKVNDSNNVYIEDDNLIVGFNGYDLEGLLDIKFVDGFSYDAIKIDAHPYYGSYLDYSTGKTVYEYEQVLLSLNGHEFTYIVEDEPKIMEICENSVNRTSLIIKTDLGRLVINSISFYSV